MTRKIAIHQRWALRLFLVVNAVWFFRIGFMLWMLIHQKPVGFDMQSFTGPFLSFLAFAQTLLPLAVLELYLRARDCGTAVFRLATAGLLAVLTIAMAAGIFAATMACGCRIFRRYGFLCRIPTGFLTHDLTPGSH